MALTEEDKKLIKKIIRTEFFNIVFWAFGAVGLVYVIGGMIIDLSKRFLSLSDNWQINIIFGGVLPFILLIVGIYLGRKFPAKIKADKETK